LLAELIEEVSLLSTEPRKVREDVRHVQRPWDNLIDLVNAKKKPKSEEPVYGPDGSVKAVGAVAAMKAMGGGAVRFAPGPAPAVAGGDA